MRKARGVSGIGGAAIATLLTVGFTAAMQAQAERKDGIKVHGHWTIDVQNADGTLASHSEIENALLPTGGSAMAGLLGKTFRPTSWRLDLSSVNGPLCERVPTPPPSPPSGPSSIAIAEPGSVKTVFNGITSWSNGFLTPGAPRFIFSPVYTVGFAPGEHVQLQLPMIVDAEGDQFQSALSGTMPAGFVMLNQSSPNQSIDWDSSLATPGDYVFNLLLSDTGGHGNQYRVFITLGTLAPPPDPGAPEPYTCSAVESTTQISSDLNNAWFPTLTLALDGGNLVMAGNVTATYAGEINAVQSVVSLDNNSTVGFSARTLQTPIQVVPGQKVYVKVVFSFS